MYFVCKIQICSFLTVSRLRNIHTHLTFWYQNSLSNCHHDYCHNIWLLNHNQAPALPDLECRWEAAWWWSPDRTDSVGAEPHSSPQHHHPQSWREDRVLHSLYWHSLCRLCSTLHHLRKRFLPSLGHRERNILTLYLRVRVGIRLFCGEFFKRSNYL